MTVYCILTTLFCLHLAFGQSNLKHDHDPLALFISGVGEALTKEGAVTNQRKINFREVLKYLVHRYSGRKLGDDQIYITPKKGARAIIRHAERDKASVEKSLKRNSRVNCNKRNKGAGSKDGNVRSKEKCIHIIDHPDRGLNLSSSRDSTIKQLEHRKTKLREWLILPCHG